MSTERLVVEEDDEELVSNFIDHHTNQDEQNTERTFEQVRQRKHIIYTCALYFSFLSIGLCSSIFNPTLIQLSTIFDTDLRHVSLIFPARSIGSTFGTLTNGFANKYVNRQIFLFSCLVMKALTIFLVPHWTSVEQFCINGFFNSFFTSAIAVMINVWINEQWSLSARRRQMEEKRKNRLGQEQQNSSNYTTNEVETDIDTSSSKIDIGNVLMQALHFFYGVGTILGPLLSEPFLRNAYTDRDGFLSNCLVLPYTVASIVVLTSSMSFFILFLMYPYDQPNTAKKTDSNQTGQIEGDSTGDISTISITNSKSPRVRYLVIFSSCVFLFVFLFSEGTWFQFSAAFATKTKLHMSESDAALLASSLAISYTTFRGLSVLIALKLSPGTMILLDLIAVTIGNSLVYLFADSSLPLFAIGIIMLGAGFASAFPSFFPFLEKHGFVVTDMVGSILVFSSTGSRVLAPFVIGLYIDTEPYIIVYSTFLSVSLSFVALFGLKSLISRFAKLSMDSANVTNVSNAF